MTLSKVVIDIVKDNSGVYAVSLMDMSRRHFFKLAKNINVNNDIMNVADRIICFDSRSIIELGLFSKDKIIDIRLLNDCDGDLSKFIQTKKMGAHRFIDLSLKLDAHNKASKISRIDLQKYSLFETFSRDLLKELFYERALRLIELSDMNEMTVPFEMSCMPSLIQIEKNGIYIDLEFVRNRLIETDTVYERKFLNSIISSHKNGFVYTLYNPLGSKTGRIRVHSGFNSMGIPRGSIRKAFVSRFTDGKICSIDYNAIDYRCMVNSVEDKDFKSLYDNCDDFYERTKQIAFGEHSYISREDIKKMCLVSLYGGSPDTISSKVSISGEELLRMLSVLQKKLVPITDLRAKLFDEAIKNGYIVLPSGRIIHTQDDIHPGKVLGLYAQGYASDIFRKALEDVQDYILENNLQTKLIFIVHDEFVFDVKEDERYHLDKIYHIISFNKFKANISIEKDYYEASK